MDAEHVEKQHNEQIFNKVDKPSGLLSLVSPTPSQDIFLNNAQFLSFMGISKRTGQEWRDQGIIGFSQVRGKIYYRLKDILKMLEDNYKPAFKGRRVSANNFNHVK
jgi:hypothetical protein